LLKREYIAIVESVRFLTVMTGHYRLARLRISLLASTRIRRDRNPSPGLLAHCPKAHIGTMARKHPKRPRDFSQAAKRVVDIATGHIEEPPQEPDTPAMEFARSGGLKGGKARAGSHVLQFRSHPSEAQNYASDGGGSDFPSLGNE
jgi:hypothetical protein